MANSCTSGHRRGVAVAPHFAAAEAGKSILAEGGNALEAMVAMAASIAAVYPHMTHIGGDGFWLVREPNGRVRALMAPGPAGSKATPAFYRERGYDAIPPRGPFAALTVPGAIGGWMIALEAAKAQGGKMPLDVLLGNAIDHARNGYTVTRSQAALTRDKLSELKEVPGFADAFLVDGKPPEQGVTLKQAAFADTLDHLTKAGLDDFYGGDVGREIAAEVLLKQATAQSYKELSKLNQKGLSEEIRKKINGKPNFTVLREGTPKTTREEYLDAFEQFVNGKTGALLKIAYSVPDGDSDVVVIMKKEDIPLIRKVRRAFAASGNAQAVEWYQSFTDILWTLAWKFEIADTVKK